MSMGPDEVQERTQRYRDMAGMASFLTGRGDGFREFDEWLDAVTRPMDSEPVSNRYKLDAQPSEPDPSDA